MPQRFVVYYSCSLCQSESTSPDKVTPWTLTGGGETRAYDICQPCQAEGVFAAFLLAGIIEHGGKKPGPKPKPPPPPPPPVLPDPVRPGEVICHYCGDAFSERGIGQHLSRVHNVKSATAMMVEARGYGPHRCPDCDFGAKAPQGLVAHRRNKHGYVSQAALERGDRSSANGVRA